MNGVRLVASEPVGFVGRRIPRFAPDDIDRKGPIGPCARCETGPRWHFTFLSASNSLWLAVPEPGPRSPFCHVTDGRLWYLVLVPSPRHADGSCLEYRLV